MQVPVLTNQRIQEHLLNGSIAEIIAISNPKKSIKLTDCYLQRSAFSMMISNEIEHFNVGIR